MKGKVYACETRLVVRHVTYIFSDLFFFCKITQRAKNRCRGLGVTWGRTISGANLCLYPLDLKHQMHIGFSLRKMNISILACALLPSRVCCVKVHMEQQRGCLNKQEVNLRGEKGD